MRDKPENKARYSGPGNKKRNVCINHSVFGNVAFRTVPKVQSYLSDKMRYPRLAIKMKMTAPEPPEQTFSISS